MKFLKLFVLPFLLDVGIWAYLLYGGFTLFYLATQWQPWQLEAKFVAPELPPLGWALVGLGILGIVFLTQVLGPSLGQRILGLGSAPKTAGPRPRWYLTLWGLTGLLLLVLTLALGWQLTGISVGSLIRDASKSLRIWRGLVNPDFRYLLAPDPGIKLSLIDGLVQSLYMALFATLVGTALAFPLSFFGARNIMARSPIGWLVYSLTRGFFNIFRAVEATYWARIFAIWVGFGAFAGTMALLIHTIAALGKLFSEQVEHIDPGPVEAVTATGANLLQVVRYAVVPQVIPQFLAFTLYRWDINLRMATVVALVGGGGIGQHLFAYKDDLEWGLVGAVILLFMITVWVMDYVSGWVRERIV